MTAGIQSSTQLEIAESDFFASTLFFDAGYRAHALFLFQQGIEKTAKALGRRSEIDVKLFRNSGAPARAGDRVFRASLRKLEGQSPWG